MKNRLYQNLSVLIVEDEDMVRDELEELLNIYFSYVHIAKDGCEGLELISKFHPDIIITDIEMPCMNGLEMMSEAKKLSINSVFIFATAFSDPEYLLSAIDNQAYAYLVKPIDFTKLFKKINELVQSDDSLTISSSKLLHKELSSREHEVFLDIARGIKPNNIAQKYDIKAKTVSTYRKRILEKMHLNSNAEIIRYSLKKDLI